MQIDQVKTRPLFENIRTRPLLPDLRVRTGQLRLRLQRSQELNQWLAVTVLAAGSFLLIGVALGVIICLALLR